MPGGAETYGQAGRRRARHRSIFPQVSHRRARPRVPPATLHPVVKLVSIAIGAWLGLILAGALLFN